MTNENSKEDAVSEFWCFLFSKLKAQQCDYVVLRNYETLPLPAGGDLDVLVDHNQVPYFLMACNKAGSSVGAIIHSARSYQNGWKVNVLLPPAQPDETPQRLEIHVQIWVSLELTYISGFVPGMSFKVFMNDITAIRIEKNGFKFNIPSPPDELVLLFRQWMFRGKEKYKKRMKEILNDPIAEESLEQLLESGLCLDSSFDTETTVEQRRATLSSMVRVLWRPKTLGRYFQALLARLRPISTSSCPLIYLSGPDGAGKTSVATVLSEYLKAANIKHRCLYSMKRNILRNAMVRWRERSPRNTKSKYRPLLIEDIEDRDTGKVMWRWRKAFNLSVSICDVFACYVVVSAMRALGATVIVETSPYEIFVKYHMPRFAILERVFAPLIPRPSAGMMLNAEANAIHERKKELYPDEITDYYDRISQIIERANCTERFTTISTDDSLEKTNQSVFEFAASVFSDLQSQMEHKE